jgi:hypothetical protein
MKFYVVYIQGKINFPENVVYSIATNFVFLNVMIFHNTISFIYACHLQNITVVCRVYYITVYCASLWVTNIIWGKILSTLE